jgi:hypothetical protein
MDRINGYEPFDTDSTSVPITKYIISLCSLTVERHPSKLVMRIQFLSQAPLVSLVQRQNIRLQSEMMWVQILQGTPINLTRDDATVAKWSHKPLCEGSTPSLATKNGCIIKCNQFRIVTQAVRGRFAKSLVGVTPA